MEFSVMVVNAPYCLKWVLAGTFWQNQCIVDIMKFRLHWNWLHWMYIYLLASNTSMPSRSQYFFKPFCRCLSFCQTLPPCMQLRALGLVINIKYGRMMNEFSTRILKLKMKIPVCMVGKYIHGIGRRLVFWGSCMLLWIRTLATLRPKMHNVKSKYGGRLWSQQLFICTEARRYVKKGWKFI